MANLEGENSMGRTEAETISSEDEIPVTTKRRRTEEPGKQSKQDGTDVGQPTKEQENSFAEIMTRSRRRRGKRVLLGLFESGQTTLNPPTVVRTAQSFCPNGPTKSESKQALKYA